MRTITIKRIPLQWILIGFGVLLYLFHFLERDPSDPYSRPIISDAKGYYAYLPAIFIYQDFDYEFLPEMDEKYYAVGQDKHIFIEVDGEPVNKTFPGVALLYLPFFLIAHFLALLLGLEADGYSSIYQYLFDFGQFFYATLGLLLAAGFLRKFISKPVHIFLSIVGVSLGTNLWFYTVYDQSVTHVYNFFLINLMLWLLALFYEKEKHLILALASFSLLLIVRPTGMLSLFLVLFFFSGQDLLKKMIRTLKSKKVWLPVFLVIGLIFAIPLILWKVQSGSWIVYSYGEEGFDFSNPNIFKFLFSYGKGWWLYSPLILASVIFGSIALFKKKDYPKLGVLVIFLALSTYVFSSWWCWYYGFSFGQRVMVDFYIVFMYLLATMFSELKTKTVVLLSPIILFLVYLNIHQSYQHYHGYYQTPIPTSEMYWDNFLSFQKKAKVYFEREDVIKTYSFDLEENLAEYKGNIVEHDEARSGKKLTFVDQEHEFSGSIDLEDKLFTSNLVVVSAFVKSRTEINQTCLVVEHIGINDTYKSYLLKEFVIKDEWVQVQFLYENNWETSNKHLHIYFWSQRSGEQLFVDDISVTIIRQ